MLENDITMPHEMKSIHGSPLKSTKLNEEKSNSSNKKQ